MAQKKNSPPKRFAAKKAPVKKTTTLSSAAKKHPATKSTAKKTQPNVKSASFHRVAEKTPFVTFALTRQTVYWIIFSVTILALAIWVLMINNKVQSLYDQIQITESQNQDIESTQPKVPTTVPAPSVPYN